ncbi:MAG TPA: type III-B CRISPR module-associated protein Cmr5 [Campylobacterales bacterium]|nr:type III-B CRISPR module-associated protein Cmr5 [Campylobacterales bacterium]
MPIRDIEKERAIFAYKKVEEAIVNQGIKQSEYKSYCKKIPSLIQTNGLSASFAFIFSKNNATYTLIYDQVDEWLKYRYNINRDEELIERLIKLDSTKYKKETIEVLALFSWMRRFAEGKISKDS